MKEGGETYGRNDRELGAKESEQRGIFLAKHVDERERERERESEGKKNAEFLRPLTRGRSVGRSYLYISRQNSQLFKNAFAAAFHGKERNSHV